MKKCAKQDCEKKQYNAIKFGLKNCLSWLCCQKHAEEIYGSAISSPLENGHDLLKFKTLLQHLDFSNHPELSHKVREVSDGKYYLGLDARLRHIESGEAVNSFVASEKFFPSLAQRLQQLIDEERDLGVLIANTSTGKSKVLTTACVCFGMFPIECKACSNV